MNMYRRNPYIVGGPILNPDSFFGRENLFNFIKDSVLEKAKVTLLSGQRRIGKSSFIKQIPNFIKLDDFSFFVADMEDKKGSSLDNILHSLAQEILEHEDLYESQITAPSLEELKSEPQLFISKFLPQVYQALGGKNLVLVLDEFDVLETHTEDANAVSLPQQLKSIVDQQEQLFIIPVLGRQLDKMPNLADLFRKAPHQVIRLLDEESAKRLITEPAKDSLKYDSDAIEAILELSAGHPYFTQIICFILFGKARDLENWTVTREDVEGIVDKAMELAEAGLLSLWQGLLIQERVVFSAIAEEQRLAALKTEPVVREPMKLLKEEYGVFLAEELNKAQELLVMWGLLQKVNNSHYKVTVELVSRWLLKQHSKEGFVQLLLSYGDESMRQKQFHLASDIFKKVLYIEPNHQSAKDKSAKAQNEIRKALRSSPFFAGIPAPPEEFVGRKEEIGRAWDIIMKSGRMCFYGSAGIGKSSFLNYLASPDTWNSRGIKLEDGQYLIVEIKCQDMIYSDFQASVFWKELLIRLKDVLSDLQAKQPKKFKNDHSVSKIKSEIEKVLLQITVEKAHVKQILKEVKEQEKFLVLLLDEYDVFLNTEGNYTESEMLKFLAECRILQEHDANGCLSTIMTFSQSPSGLSLKSQSLLNNLPDLCLPLKLFEDSELDILWQRMHDRWKSEKTLLRNVKETTGGHPALFQIFCSFLYEQLSKKETPHTEILNLAFETTINHGILKRIWNSLNNLQRILLQLICLENLQGKIGGIHFNLKSNESTFKKSKSILDELKVTGFIQSNQQDKEIYSFTASVMQQWVIEEILKNEGGEVKELERVLGGVITQGHVDKMKQAIKWLRDNPEAVRNVSELAHLIS